MANYATIARPYAKAIFEHALKNNILKEWSTVLQACTLIVSEPNATEFINNPATLPEQQIEFFIDLLRKFSAKGASLKTELPAITNFLTLLAHNKRVFALPAISVLFDQMRADQEKTLNVDVISFSPLSKEQRASLVSKLKHKLKREIELSVTLDETLLGGAVIQAGDLVIDGSVYGDLKKLRANLVA